MNSVIRPDSHHPVIGHTVVGPAAPTVAEGKLREEFDALSEEVKKLRSECSKALQFLSQFAGNVHRRGMIVEVEAHYRLKALESRWHERLVLWFRKVFRCQ